MLEPAQTAIYSNIGLQQQRQFSLIRTANMLFDRARTRSTMSTMPGEYLDLSSDPPQRRESGRGSGRPFLGVRFACCDIYQRIYPNREGTAYEGACPRCGKQVRFLIGSGGTDARFFEVS